MTRTTPRRRTILHLSQIRLTDARTFIVASYSHLTQNPQNTLKVFSADSASSA